MAATTTQDHSTGEHDWHSAEYVDWWITRDQSRDAERRVRLREMLSHISFGADAEFSVLDVGGGYGVLTEEVVAAFSRARVTLADYSEPMLAQARQRLSAYVGRISYVHCDLTDPGWVTKVGGPFDAAVSAIVIHNLRDQALIADAYRGVARTLKPGGVFLDYDLFFEAIGGLDGNSRMLRDAGFSRVDCLWQQAPLATIAARAG